MIHMTSSLLPKKYCTTFFVIILLFSVSGLDAATYFVDAAGPNGSGLSWATAKTTLAGALSASSPGDEILVKYGTYTITNDIKLTSNRLITSDGGSGTNWADATPDSSQCILSASGCRIFTLSSNGITNATRIRGLKMMNGDATTEDVWFTAGGAIVVYGGASPIIEQCWITNNTSSKVYQNLQASGGAIYARETGSNPIIRNNNFSNNITTTANNSSTGGAICADWGSTPEIYGNIFRNNKAGVGAGHYLDYATSGGAIYLYEGSPKVYNNIFDGNIALERRISYDNANWGANVIGGAICTGNNCNIQIKNNLFINNLGLNCPDYNIYQGQGSVAQGGAISASGNVVIENNTFINNSAKNQYAYSASGSAGAIFHGSTAVIRNNIFVNHPSTSNAAIYGTSLTIKNNAFHNNYLNYASTGTITSLDEITADPQFISVSSSDYRLAANSPCINAGDTLTNVDTFPVDLAGQPRRKGGIVDIGAYEFQVDDPPQITSAAAVTATEDIYFNYRVTAEDSDNAPLLITIEWLPGWLTFDSDSIFGTPREGAVDTSFRIIASDGGLYDTLTVAVTVIAVNDTPMISEIADQTIYMNCNTGPLSFTIADIETTTAELTVTAVSSNPALVPDDNIVLAGSDSERTVTVTPVSDKTGLSTITLTVNDGELSAASSFILSVKMPNSAPAFIHESIPDGLEDQPYEFSFSVNDADGDSVSVTPVALPAWLALELTPAQIKTIAGNGNNSDTGDGGLAINAQLKDPTSIAVGPDGSIYIAEESGYRVRRIAPDGIISTFAGTGIGTSTGDGGLATAATLRSPRGVAVDPIGNEYISEYYGYKIRKVDTTGVISTIAGTGSYGFSGDGGAATSAQLYYPEGVTVGPDNCIYIADSGNQRIRRIDSAGIISTVAGNGGRGFSGDGGSATSAWLYYPHQVAFDQSNNMYIADFGNNRIRMVDSDGVITTVAGSGVKGYSGDGGLAINAQLNLPSSIEIDNNDNLLICDQSNNRIRIVTPSGIINTLAGDGNAGFGGDNGDPTAASLKYPSYLAVTNTEEIFIVDRMNYRLRQISPRQYILAGTPGDSDTGANQVNISAYDGAALSNLDFTITIVNINDPPAITSPAGVLAVEDQRFAYHATASDPDSPQLDWTFPVLPAWLATTADSIFGIARHGDIDTVFTAIVTDGEYFDTMQVAVTVQQINDPPLITSAGNTLAVEDQYFVYRATASDEEADPVSLTFAQYPNWLTAAADSIFGTPMDGVVDSSFLVIASDGSSSDSMLVILSVQAINDPPVITSADTAAAIEDQYFVYRCHAQDPDNGNLTWSFPERPNWLYAAADSLYGTPRQGDHNSSFTIIVSDGEYSDTLVVALLVQPVNDPPAEFILLQPADATTIMLAPDNLEQSLALLWSSAGDEEGDSVFYTLQLTAGLNILMLPAITDTSITWTYAELVALLDTAANATGSWTVTASDRQQTISAANGPFTLTIDRSALAIAGGLPIPEKFALHPNYPNPFNPATTICYDLPEQTAVKITIYDLQGRLVKTLVDRIEEPGYRSIRWDGTNVHGRQVSAGMYICLIRTAEYQARRKMLLLK
ncbi:MAG: choice-of-anchor Q domain-containing protein [Candidatus Neomarinimicrobiota bacterium]